MSLHGIPGESDQGTPSPSPQRPTSLENTYRSALLRISALVSSNRDPDVKDKIVALVEEALRHPSQPPVEAPRAPGRPAALGEMPEKVKIEGIPNPVSGPKPDAATYRKEMIPVAERGTQRTLEKMAEMTVEASRDPYFVSFARGLVRECGARDYECLMETIHRFVRKNVKYRNDPTFMEWITTPGWTLFVDGQADCDEMSQVIAALLLAVGIPQVAFRAVWLDRSNPTEASHVYVVAKPPGYDRWVPLDAVAFDSPGKEPPPAERVRAPLDWPVGG